MMVAALDQPMRSVAFCRAPMCHAEAKFDGFCRAHAPIHAIRAADGLPYTKPVVPHAEVVVPRDVDEDAPFDDDFPISLAEEPDEAFATILAKAARDSGAPRVTGHGIARWTREKALAAVQEWARAKGRPPRQKDTVGDSTLPSPSSVRAFGMTWADLIETAGFPRPMRGGSTRPASTPEAKERIRDGMHRETARREATWVVSVPGTGLRYRTADEAFTAAEEIEADGARVAEDSRFDGDEAKAEQAIDTSRDLAERVRIAARMAERANGNGHAVLVEREPEAGEERVAASPPAAEREATASAAAGKGPVSPPELVLEAASRSTSTDTEQLAQFHADRGKIDAYLATLDEAPDEGAEQEAPISEVLIELGCAIEASEAAGNRLVEAGAALRRHSLYEQVRNWV